MEKNTIKYWANNSRESKDIKESLLEKGLQIKHIVTASELPVIKDAQKYTIGAKNIRIAYNL